MIDRARYLLIAACAFLFVPCDALALTGGIDRKTFEISRTDTPPVIDGRLDDAIWATAATVDDFHQTAPTDGATPSEATVNRRRVTSMRPHRNGEYFLKLGDHKELKLSRKYKANLERLADRI